MAPELSGLSSGKRTSIIRTYGEPADEVPSKGSASSAQARILLQALQNYIFPLVNTPRDQKKNDTSHISRGPEAGKFLSALQEFVLSIIRSESDSIDQNGIEVDLNGDSENKYKDTDPGINDIILSPTNIPLPAVEIPERDTRSDDGRAANAVSGQRERILGALRERVFNVFPIRLLHIVPLGSKLQIRLLERGGVYAHLAKQLEADYTESVFHSEVEKLRAQRVLSQEHAERDAMEEWILKYAKYSILSHTWIRTAGAEVTYDDWLKNRFDPQRLGYQKLVNFCKATWTDHGLTLGWMDTVCINKQSSSELDESIRSMYKWYRTATVCITYLSGTRVLSDMRHDPWFTRGWTFQELLAPQRTKFYNTDWKKLVKSYNDNKDSYILNQIDKATTIEASELKYGPQKMPISRKMQLAAKRKVTREEDIAYSLMGLCDVSMPIAYGEGAKRAFSRLMSEILSSSPDDVLDVFNCAQKEPSPIPSTPLPYIERSNKFDGLVTTPVRQKPIEPLLLTHLGLRIPILLMPSLPAGSPNFKNNPIGDYYATATVPVPKMKEAYTGPCHLLDKGLSVSNTIRDGLTWTVDPLAVHTIIGVLNFGGDKTNIKVSTTCLAIGFSSRWNVEWEAPSTSIIRIETMEPIVFQLMKRSIPGETKYHFGFLIKQTELEKHGMKIVTMYL